MELSAKLLHDVEFKERWRGYDPDEVDAFLEQVARGVEALQDRLRDAERTERASRNGRVERDRAEPTREVREAAREPRDLGTEDELRRVLVLAQRTADTAVAEARDQADRLLAEARAHAEQVTSTADAYAARVRREADEDVARRVQAAEDEVAAAGAGAVQRLQDEVAGLEGRRDDLHAVVAGAEAHLSEHRARAQLAVEQLQRLVDDPASLGAVPMGAVATVATATVAVSATEPPADADGGAADLLEPELAGDELAWDDLDDDDDDGYDDDAAQDELDDLDESDAGDDDLEAADELDDLDATHGRNGNGAPAAAQLIDLAESPALLDDASTGELYLGLDDVPSVGWGDGAVHADGGPATQAMAPLPDDVNEDAYLAELRQAIAADESLSPAAEAFFNQAAYEDDRWKGLRRRR